jgi:tungstate transport system substrate-binding protein
MEMKRILVGVLAAVAMLPAMAQQRYVTVASTTSTEQSGLFKHLLPLFERKTGIQVRVVALGTGQALDMGKRGDADVVFVHARTLEEKFVAEGFGVKRLEVMYNDFVLIGPKTDPAKVAGGKDVLEAFRKVKAAQAPFVSRGDKSGTHFAELQIWKEAGIDIAKDKGRWYRDTGQGMGPALNSAAGMNAYILADRGTWLSFRNRAGLTIVVEGDKRLFNQYGIILVNPAKHAAVKKDIAQAFIDWVVSPEGQKVIAEYKIGGEPLFVPNAR